MTGRVRVRYAPSPTGEPHVGNIRTAIFDWLFAKHHDGDFIIRIEDTDQNRKVEGAVEVQLNALRWLGLDWDEGPNKGGDYGPYVQSERLGTYQRVIGELIESGNAYRCYCSSERLTKVREEQAKRKGTLGYDRHCRDLTDSERKELHNSGVTPVVRFKMPLEGSTTLSDLVRGDVTFENQLVDDFVMLKSDGYPTYHLAHVVDDHLMEISHVFRGEDWLSSAPRHLQLYKALGWEPPEFAHLPNILAADRSKLSKRHGATSILHYEEAGYLPQAMLNFLTLLGWSLDDKTELFTQDELANHFSIERVSRSGAIFNTEKLDWMNGHYIREMSHEELADALIEFWKRYPAPEIPSIPSRDFALQIAPLVQERLKTLGDAAPLISFFFQDELSYDSEELVQKGMDANGTRVGLQAAHGGLADLEPFNAQSMEDLLRPLSKDLNVKVGQLFGSLRVATTGLRVAPPLFETMEILGKERTLDSIQKAIDSL
ncbi:MAG: glutamate--tRNA ligase [SAR202 cluster bacterium Casp-Chloro-G4]|nr:glutamate--tRNA ligase [Chloroflexota bacterium]MDA1228403.1 glutamate--tRNA ligase [Chloroflexota bacterium]PKB62116.1 MAG: glutamate--tRNA ligase [SAR202 cluster bacterium Casp-Chloro-G4]